MTGFVQKLSRIAPPVPIMGASLLLAGCEAPEQSQAERLPGPNYSIENSDISNGFFAIAESDVLIEGRRPTLVLSCGDGVPRLQLHLVETPSQPPPFKGVFGAIRVDENPPVPVELAWATGDDWILRENDRNQADLVRSMLRGDRVRFTGPPGYSSNREIRWTLTGFGSRLDMIRRACS